MLTILRSTGNRLLAQPMVRLICKFDVAGQFDLNILTRSKSCYAIRCNANKKIRRTGENVVSTTAGHSKVRVYMMSFIVQSPFYNTKAIQLALLNLFLPSHNRYL